MPNAAEPAFTAGEIVFELERFEPEGDRLALRGRWFGVRGRRFVRPTLSLGGAARRSRVLADLEHKPWAAEDGASWEAAFPWIQPGRPSQFELSVAPDITIQLPAPSGKRGTPRRLSALPRRAAVFSSAPSITSTSGSPEQGQAQAPPRDPERERLEIELRTLKAKLEAVSGELKKSRAALSEREHELEAVREQLAAVEADRDRPRG